MPYRWRGSCNLTSRAYRRARLRRTLAKSGDSLTPAPPGALPPFSVLSQSSPTLHHRIVTCTSLVFDPRRSRFRFAPPLARPRLQLAHLRSPMWESRAAISVAIVSAHHDHTLLRTVTYPMGKLAGVIGKYKDAYPIFQHLPRRMFACHFPPFSLCTFLRRSSHPPWTRRRYSIYVFRNGHPYFPNSPAISLFLRKHTPQRLCVFPTHVRHQYPSLHTRIQTVHVPPPASSSSAFNTMFIHGLLITSLIILLYSST
ncbi:hypothetical protein BC834DRAFT_461199 [Gloeopeniophorella convolvens]|nr:hypothetical protein BC834DRAFT_461199 [Gloeopeniophorella convolvens]